MKKRHVLITAFMMVCQTMVFGQLTQVYHDPVALYQSGLDLMIKEKYGAAKEVMQQVVELTDEEQPMRIHAEFCVARCSYELLNSDARGQLTQFIWRHPESSYVPVSWFYTGNTWYRDKNYKKAIDAFSNTSEKYLSDEQGMEYLFKKGYSYFMIDSMLAARACFIPVKESESIYRAPAIYYYSHISYTEGQYEVALTGFRSLLEDETFGAVSPYYIAQIYYLQGKYDDLIAFVPPMLEKPDVKRQAEMSRMTGDAYFSRKEYRLALPYYEMYSQKTTVPLTREDYYQIGYTYYNVGDYQKATENLSNVATMEDSLNQNASYHLADCYLKIGNKKFALNCFYDAYRLNFNPLITEDALFNYARLSYELDYHPYNGAIKALQQYLNDFPKSLRAEEARELLVDLLMSTGNYKDAIGVIESIKVKTERIWSAYQKVNYYHGVEVFNSKSYMDAVSLFNKAIGFNYDRSIRAEALYWKGESYYRLAVYDSSAACYDMFVKYPPSADLPYFSRGYYGLGYAQMQRKNYSGAQQSFLSYFKYAGNDDKWFRNDAQLRLADCYFIMRKWEDAIENYDKSLAMKVEYMDYALLQKSKCEGVMGNYKGRQNTLAMLTSQYPSSRFADDALFESGINYELQDQNNKALESYDALIVNHPESPLRVQALLKKGALYRIMGENSKAINVFKQVVDEYKGTEDSKDALMNLKAIYTDIGKPDEFFKLVADMGNSVPEMTKDSMLYQSAENSFMKGDCSGAVLAFNNYLSTFPSGSFALNAHFYRSECQYGNKEYDLALSGYEYVASQPVSAFTETSLLKAARIHYNKKSYDKATIYYRTLEQSTQSLSNKLEAQKSIMYAAYESGQYNEAILAAQQYQANPTIQQQESDEASAVIARSAYQLSDLPKAQTEFTKLIKLRSSVLGAEANYYLALIEYQNGRYQESEKLVFDLINDFASFEFWVAKSFILLSDVYVASNNFYQAKYALQSVIDNYEGEDLREEARTKLNTIIELEKKNEQDSNGEGEIIINGSNE